APPSTLFPYTTLFRSATKPGLVFWPRTARISGTEVRFEALLDSAFVRLPLIFVDNTAAHDPAVIESLINYYKSIPNPDESIQSRSEEHTSELQSRSDL